MTSRRYRVDANQKLISDALKKSGCSVLPIHTLGRGAPDLLVGVNACDEYYGIRKNVLLELKNGELPPSAQKLTADEEKWHATWKGQVCVVNSVEEALDAVGVE